MRCDERLREYFRDADISAIEGLIDELAEVMSLLIISGGFAREVDCALATLSLTLRTDQSRNSCCIGRYNIFVALRGTLFPVARFV